MSVLVIILGLLFLILFVVFLISCILHRKDMKRYVKYGVILGVTLILLDTAVLLLIPNAFRVIPFYKIVVVDILAFVRITLFACVGMYCCSVLKLPDLPVMRGLFGELNGPERIRIKTDFAIARSTVILGVIYSVILFKVTSPQISQWLKELSEARASRLGISTAPSMIAALAVLEFAFAEEILFRLGIQNYLAKVLRLNAQKYWVAVVITAAFWSLAHANILEPEWVKIAQVYPLGLALGLVFHRCGTEMCIVTHGLFNLAMIFFSPLLIT